MKTKVSEFSCDSYRILYEIAPNANSVSEIGLFGKVLWFTLLSLVTCLECAIPLIFIMLSLHVGSIALLIFGFMWLARVAYEYTH